MAKQVLVRTSKNEKKPHFTPYKSYPIVRVHKDYYFVLCDEGLEREVAQYAVDNYFWIKDKSVMIPKSMLDRAKEIANG